MSFGVSIGDILKICEIAGRVYKNCRDCTGEYKSLATEARSLTNLLDDISDKYEKIPENKRQQLVDAYEPCIEVLQDLDKLLLHYNSLDTKSKRAWDRLKWDPDKSRTLRDRLTSSVSMLNTFYTSLLHDSQVLILEALQRLEQDYKGGHREESIASIERITSGTAQEDDEDDDAAWNQILRDLEDVGVSQQEALKYRNTIIDWLVAAVNQGRLLEQNSDDESFSSLQQDLGAALPTFEQPEYEEAYSRNSSSTLPPVHRSTSAPFPHLTPLTSPPTSPDQSGYLHPSAVSLPLSGRSSTSMEANSPSLDDDTSLYDPPEPLPKSARPLGSGTYQIRRVPVPPPSNSYAQNVSLLSTTAAPPAPQRTPPPVPPPPTVPPPSVVPSQPPSSPPYYISLPLAVSPLPEKQVPSSTPPQPAMPSPLTVPTQPSMPPSPGIPTQPVMPPPPPMSTQPAMPASFFVPETSTAPPLFEPPAYNDKSSSTTADLEWTAHQIMAAWDRRDFPAAERLLLDQLAAVERGQALLSGAQPDRRILRHLLGVCASFMGSFVKAKQYFESVINGIYLNHRSLDEGDIAASLWLADSCLHLREHQNALLAYGVAFEGCIGRYGIVRDRTRRVAAELRLLDHWLYAFRRVEHSFALNVDPTDIFASTHAIEKSNLLVTVKTRLYDAHQYGGALPPPPLNSGSRPAYTIVSRPKIDIAISRGFLLSPLISQSSWPLPWDPTFSPTDAVQLDRHMNTVRIAKVIQPLVTRQLPTSSFGESKKLHYVTKRGSEWLINTVKAGLRDIGIEHAEHGYEASIICCLNQHRDGFAFSEGVEISFKKLQFRNVYGIRISDVKWSSRRLNQLTDETTRTQGDTTDFRNMIKGVLESAEAEPNVSVPQNNIEFVEGMYGMPPPAQPFVKRPAYG